jgi:hypothetical protein
MYCTSKSFLKSITVGMLVAAGSVAAHATSITTLNTPFNLNLAGYNANLTTLPTGVTGAFIAGTDNGVRERGFTSDGSTILSVGTPAPLNYSGASNSGGFYSWGSATGTTSTSNITAATLAWQATGGSSNLSNTVSYTNNTGSTITGLTFGFDAYQWRRSTGTRLSEVILSSTPNAAGFTPFTFAGTGSAASATGRAFGAPAPSGFAADRNYTSTWSGLNVADGESFSFTFTFNRDGATVGAGSAQALAVGNISITAVPEPSTLAISGVAALALVGGICRRFRKSA